MARGAPSVVLILAEGEDASGAWLADGLRARGLAAELVTPAELCAATSLEHRLGDGPATLRIGLEDGRTLDGRDAAGAVNRMLRVPLAVLARAEPEDRLYVEAEWRALLCSVLRAVRGRVLDPADPHRLPGRWRSPPEWLALAHRAGLATPRWGWDDDAPAPTSSLDAEGEIARVLVAGDHASALGPVPVSPETVDACRRLAALVAASVLEVRLVAGARRPAFAFADQLPDLRDGGEGVVAAFARMLRA